MTDQRMTFELRELERWFSTYPQPELDMASRHILKVCVRETLNDGGLGDSQVHAAPDELRQRLKAAVRQELAEQENIAKVFPLFSLRQLSPWLSSAAALVFVILGFGLLGRNVQPISDRPPIDVVSATDGELASIGAELAYLELQSYASDFVFFGSGDIDSDLKDEIEREFLPSLYHDSTDDSYPEGVSQ
ncbi:MAG: anti-sigma factor [Planctomycetes bacterium]|nr:anti-sigma factor [Planctomycetota bacterium]